MPSTSSHPNRLRSVALTALVLGAVGVSSAIGFGAGVVWERWTPCFQFLGGTSVTEIEGGVSPDGRWVVVQEQSGFQDKAFWLALYRNPPPERVCGETVHPPIMILPDEILATEDRVVVRPPSVEVVHGVRALGEPQFKWDETTAER